MPRTPIANRWISVTRRSSDGRLFAGNTEVTIEPDQKRQPPWKLTKETALGIGLADSEVITVIGWDPDGTASCECRNKWRATCTRSERQGKSCEKKTCIIRNDYWVRLHFCRLCNGPFIAHYSMKHCSETCARENQKAWHEARRLPPRPPSKAAQRRAALAGATCLVCGEPFKPARLSARFCSNGCRQKHHRQTAGNRTTVSAT
jgi:hypothetical protein